MSYANDRVEAARRRSLEVTFNTDLEVYEPSESYSPGDGFDITRPDPETDTPDATYKARAMEPEGEGERERGGTTNEIDRRFQVRDDIGQQWTGFGESGEAATHVRETGTGVVYVVTSVTDAHDGRTKLECSEV